MAATYAELSSGLDGLTDEEFFWEPVRDCWTVYRDETGRWTYHYEEPDPVPAPFTTIGWRLAHVALCKVIYHEWAFGPRELNFMNIDNPRDVATSVEMLERGHDLLTQDLFALTDDAELGRSVLTNWGEEWPAWRIFWTMVDHDARHGAEIRLLRDLHRANGTGPAPAAG